MVENGGKNDTPLPALSANQEKAVRSVMLGKLSGDEIAGMLGIGTTTLERWRRLPAFKKRLDQLRGELREEMGRGTIADSLERLKKRNERWKRNTNLTDRRAERFTALSQELGAKPLGHIPSEDEQPAVRLDIDADCLDELQTGLYKKRVYRRYDKATGALVGEEVFAEFDVGLYRALHDDELLTAKELGEIVSRAEVSGPGGMPIQMQMEVGVVGYAHGGIADALRYWKEIADAGRLPQTDEDVASLLSELDARDKAARQGKPVPPMSEPYIPALDILNEQED